MSDCNRCLWATRNGSCASWDCRFVDQREAYEAYNRGKADANKWIPCSERLPEIGEYVLCSQDNGDVGEGKLLDSGSWLICYDQICHGSYWVNAWMPLPEPYKEGKE